MLRLDGIRRNIKTGPDRKSWRYTRAGQTARNPYGGR